MAKYEFIDFYAATPKTSAVLKMRRWLEASWSGCYHWRSRPVLAAAVRRQAGCRRPEVPFTGARLRLGTSGTWCSCEGCRVLRQCPREALRWVRRPDR